MSYCDCDLEYPAIYNESTVRARKHHTCSDCRGEIKPKETYKTISGLWDGKFSTYKQCQDCTVIRCDLGELYDGCDCIGLGNLMSFLCEDIQDETIPIIAAFNAASKARNGKQIKL
jgi:hypothetical protein